MVKITGALSLKYLGLKLNKKLRDKKQRENESKLKIKKREKV